MARGRAVAAFSDFSGGILVYEPGGLLMLSVSRVCGDGWCRTNPWAEHCSGIAIVWVKLLAKPSTFGEVGRQLMGLRNWSKINLWIWLIRVQ